MTRVLSAMRTCEVCGGDPTRGSVASWDPKFVAYNRPGRKPVAHVDSERHKRQALLTRRAAEGWVLLAGSYWWRSGQWGSLGFTVVDHYFDTFGRGGSCPWEGFFGHPHGFPTSSTWTSVDGCREVAAEFVNIATAELQREPNADWAKRRLEIAGHLQSIIDAADIVAAHDTPWWRAVREQAGWERMPAWSIG